MTAATPRTKLYWTGWIVSGLVSAFLAFSASLKFFMPDIVRETMSGLGWPAHHDLFIGIIEVACVVLYLIPQTAVLSHPRNRPARQRHRHQCPRRQSAVQPRTLRRLSRPDDLGRPLAPRPAPPRPPAYPCLRRDRRSKPS